MASWNRKHSNGWSAMVFQTDKKGKEWDGAVVGGHDDLPAPQFVRHGKSPKRVMELVDAMVGEHQHTCTDACGEWTEQASVPWGQK